MRGWCCESANLQHQRRKALGNEPELPISARIVSGYPSGLPTLFALFAAKAGGQARRQRAETARADRRQLERLIAKAGQSGEAALTVARERWRLSGSGPSGRSRAGRAASGP